MPLLGSSLLAVVSLDVYLFRVLLLKMPLVFVSLPSLGDFRTEAVAFDETLVFPVAKALLIFL